MSRLPTSRNRAAAVAAAAPERTGLLDVDSLAERLGVSPRFVRRLVSERRVPFLKIGKFVRFDPREIDEWVDEQRRPAATYE